MDVEIQVRRLQMHDERSSFRCGNIDLDRFFQRYAGQSQFRHHIGTTYVAIAEDQIAGFVTVSMGELAADSITRKLRKRLPAYPPTRLPAYPPTRYPFYVSPAWRWTCIFRVKVSANCC